MNARRWKTSAIVGAAIATLPLVVGCGSSGDDEREIRFVGRERSLATNDQAAPGVSAGDERAGTTLLYDVGGRRRAGTVHWTLVLTAQDGARRGSTGISSAVIQTPQGDMVALGGLGIPGSALSGRQNVSDFAVPVVGGTGTYAGSRGELRRTLRPNGEQEYVVRLQDDD